MVKVLIPSGALGIGFDRSALARGVAQNPDIIAIDGGSTDSGPHYLGTGTSKYSRGSIKAEWKDLMAARAEAGVPLIIGTAGTSGADDAVDWLLEITRDIAAETGEALKVAVLKSGQKGEAMAGALALGRITPLTPAPEISPERLTSCTNIVALSGAEQIQAAIDTGADIIIAGRTTDTAIIAALPLARGCHPGAAWHGAKVGECGAIATTHPGSGTILITFDDEGFVFDPMGEEARATPYTVSAHMLYENADPYILHEPGGHLDVTEASYVAIDDRRVRVTGSAWVPSDRYTVKLEGARIAGYQSVSIVLIREPRYVENVQAWCEGIRQACMADAVSRVDGEVSLAFRIIGADATLGDLEKTMRIGSEVGVMAIVTADSEAASKEVAKMLNPYLLHHPLDPHEPMPTFAFPFSPTELYRGEVCEFCLNHVLQLDDPMDAFRLSNLEIGR